MFLHYTGNGRSNNDNNHILEVTSQVTAKYFCAVSMSRKPEMPMLF